MKISDIKHDPNNANKGSDRGSRLIKESLKKFGTGRSIVVDKHGVAIGGNKTLEQAGALGMEEVILVPSDGTKLVVVQRTDLDLAEDVKAQELALADNRASEVSMSWDSDVLASIETKVDLSQFFKKTELDQILGRAPVKLRIDDDEVPEPQHEVITKPGDLITLGSHRLICGDATDGVSLERLMDGKRADLVVTDPPYNVDYTGKTADQLKVENDKMSDRAFFYFLRAAFGRMIDVMHAGAGIYVCHADMEGINFRTAFDEAGFKLASVLIWVKQTLVLGRGDYQWQHEPILYGWKPGAAHRWFSDRKQTTVWNFDRPQRSSEHPTMKPVALIQYAIGNSSQAGDIVLDPFGGSGTTLIACEKTNRVCHTIELNPSYVDVIVARWEAATGQKATRHARVD